MSKVFISYRRDDSAGYAHAIHSRLVQHFSKDQVFMDVDTMEPGVDFVRAIEKAVGECDVLVALIGKRWTGSEPGGMSRFDNPKDYVRLEVSTALSRDIRVIPVLVDGVIMPNEDSLPPPVQPITRRNAIEISNTRFNYDVDQLITAVRKILDATERKRKADEEAERNRIEQEAEQRHLEAEAQRKAEEQRLREQETQRSEEAAKRTADEDRRRIEEERNRARQEAEQRRIEAKAQRELEEERLREQERKRTEEGALERAEQEERRHIEEQKNRARQEEERRHLEAEIHRRQEDTKQKTVEPDRRRTEQEVPSPWRTYGPVIAVVAVVLVIFSFVFWWPKGAIKEVPMVEPQPPPKEIVASAPEQRPEDQKETIKETPMAKLQPREPERAKAQAERKKLEEPRRQQEDLQRERADSQKQLAEPRLKPESTERRSQQLDKGSKELDDEIKKLENSLAQLKSNTMALNRQKIPYPEINCINSDDRVSDKARSERIECLKKQIQAHFKWILTLPSEAFETDFKVP